MTRRLLLYAIACLALAGIGLSAHAYTRLAPEAPRAGQEFVFLSTDNEGCVTPGTLRSEVSGQRVTIAYRQSALCASGSLTYVMTVLKLPAGTYEVVERGEVNGVPTAAGRLGSITIAPAAPVTRTTSNLDGMWYVPTQPGWGVSLTEGGSGQLFLGWYHYGFASCCAFTPQKYGRASWFFASSGAWVTPTRYQAPLYRSAGGNPEGNFDLSALAVSPVGLATLDVNADGSVRFNVLYLFATGETIIEDTLTKFRF